MISYVCILQKNVLLCIINQIKHYYEINKNNPLILNYIIDLL